MSLQFLTDRNVPEQGAGDWFDVEGAGENEDPVNGVFVQQPRFINNKPYYMRLSIKVCSDPMVIWYNNNPKRKCWMINNRSQADTDNAKCVIKSEADTIDKATSKQGWFEFDMNTGQFSKSAIKIQKYSDEDRDDVIQKKLSQIIVEGRKGYNRAMNGTYNRLPKLRGGKSCYKHSTNDFQIRWFETKWVVDWRKGNHDDNLGAAVCKEDVPEPWMCTIPWRIYDGKAKEKKWKFDQLTKIGLAKTDFKFQK